MITETQNLVDVVNEVLEGVAQDKDCILTATESLENDPVAYQATLSHKGKDLGEVTIEAGHVYVTDHPQLDIAVALGERDVGCDLRRPAAFIAHEVREKYGC